MIGTENKGLNHMFTFINTSRIGTAFKELRRQSYRIKAVYGMPKNVYYEVAEW